MKNRLAIVDDQIRMAQVLAMVLEQDTLEVFTFSSAIDFLLAAEKTCFDVLLTDLRMPDVNGLSLLKTVKEKMPHCEVIVMTAYGTVSDAVEAMKLGAADFLEKPIDNALARITVSRVLEVQELRANNAELKDQLRGSVGVIAHSESMRQVLNLLTRAAKSRAGIFITGESGTGKEVIAKLAHAHSDRFAGPFVPVNCAAIASGVLESELFGHEKGAFTGADTSRPGLFESADGGTLFLDEVGELGVDLQSKLLRVLQEREVRRVGAARSKAVDFRLVSATNRNLEAEVKAGRFRQDLYFRLNVIPVHLPSLRDRPQDILPLARHFFDRACQELLPAQCHSGASPKNRRDGWKDGHKTSKVGCSTIPGRETSGNWRTRLSEVWCSQVASTLSLKISALARRQLSHARPPARCKKHWSQPRESVSASPWKKPRVCDA